MHNRIFINHPKVGTIMVRKTRPGYKNYRYQQLKDYILNLQYAGALPFGFQVCKICNAHLINPHSILMHIGNGCEKNKK